jgi:uncharacterized protein YcfL
MRKLLFGLLLFIVSCNSGEPDQTTTSQQDTLTKSKPAAIDTSAKTTIKQLTDQNQIIGVWESENKEPLTVEINKDSIYYTEHFESHRYKLRGDSIFINYPDFVFAAKVYFYGDTLVMESEDGKFKFVKFKQ